MATIKRNADEIVAHLRGVRDAVHAHAEHLAAKARTNLARHRRTGTAHIAVTRGTTDAHASLVDSAAASIEFGHFTDNGEADAKVTFVPGLRILRDAADL